MCVFSLLSVTVYCEPRPALQDSFLQSHYDDVGVGVGGRVINIDKDNDSNARKTESSKPSCRPEDRIHALQITQTEGLRLSVLLMQTSL